MAQTPEEAAQAVAQATGYTPAPLTTEQQQIQELYSKPLPIGESQATSGGTVTVEAAPQVFTENQVNQSLASQDVAVQPAPTSGGDGAGTTGNAFTSQGADDGGTSSTSVTNALTNVSSNVFGEGSITPQDNVLDQYASYTYQASVYLMKPEAFQAMVTAKKFTPTGSQLLFQSGGAPVAGRNPYFSNDYYIDKIELKSTLTGKGTNAAHNVNTIKMTLVEPSGITLMSNLDKAVQQYLGAADAKKNFASALYLLVIKFFGYDANGNLVQAGQSNGITNAIGGAVGGILGGAIAAAGTAHVEKYYPMAINKINFRVANKLVEYEIEATAPQYNVAVGSSRGTIPYSVELSGMSVKDALAGSAEVGLSAAAQAASTTITNKLATTATKTIPRDEATSANGGSNPPSAPSNASAAPSPKLTIRKGLMEALNQYQKDLVDKKIYTVADVYSIEFTDSSIEQAKITVPGVDFKNTSPQVAKTAGDKVLPEKQSVDSNSRIITITAGQQIVQVIEQAVRNSEYIRNQATSTVEENTQKQKTNSGTKKDVTWFKINVQTTPIKYDPKRNDYAYNVKYIVSPFKLVATNSNYFAQPQYRGAQKQYNYWFTGQNTQVISYEQQYNAAYTYILSGGTQTTANTTNAKTVYQPRSGQTSQGADLRTNEPAANLADSLYNPADLAEARLTIVGDPAWLHQGEASFSAPGKGSFNASAFLPDGTINFDSQQILFEIVINTPTDYDLATGLMDVNNRNTNQINNQGKPLNESYVYIANECISEFVKGKFTQNLKGGLLQRTTPASSASNGRAGSGLGGLIGSAVGGVTGAVKNLFNSSDTRTTGIPQSQADTQDSNASADSGIGTGSTDANNVDGENDPPTPQPAAPPGEPTSGGDIAPSNNPTPPNMPGPNATADQFNINGVQPTPDELAARNAYRAAGSPSSGPLYDSYASSKESFANRIAATAPTTTSSAPQNMNRET
jgi:hypothetical protein